MNTVRSCGCKGIRSCLQCENNFNISRPSKFEELHLLDAWTYCPKCERIYPGWDTNDVQEKHHEHNKEIGKHLPGVYVKECFLTPEEGAKLICNMDSFPWAISQSGRRKQNYGPKTNFKKRKLQNGNFTGFPNFSKFIQQRFSEVDELKNFQVIEQCSLEYDPEKGACIDPHIDDCWIWGERVVTVNCLGDSVLTLLLYERGQHEKYNLDLIKKYEDRLMQPLLNEEQLSKFKGMVIRIPMPNLSLIVLYGPARFQFEHLILREDIHERRVCLAYREFTTMYIDGESKNQGDIVRDNAQLFW